MGLRLVCMELRNSLVRGQRRFLVDDAPFNVISQAVEQASAANRRTALDNPYKVQCAQSTVFSDGLYYTHLPAMPRTRFLGTLSYCAGMEGATFPDAAAAAALGKRL